MANETDNTPKFDERNYLNTRLAKGETKREVTIRIIPQKTLEGKMMFAIPVEVHTMTVDKEVSESGFKTFVCLKDKNYGNDKGCPICERTKEMFEEAKQFEKGTPESKSLFRKAFQMRDTHKTAYIVKCIERGKEDEGIKFWRFNSWANGNGSYDKIRNLAEQRNKESIAAGRGILNIFDFEEGYDLILTITRSDKSNEKGVEKTEINITDAKFPSKLSNDPAQAQAWIEDPKDWKELFKQKPYDYLKIIADGDIPWWSSEEGTYVPKQNVNHQ